MPKLNQIIAIEKSVKSRTFQELTEAHHALQKPALLSGIARTYRPKDDDGEQLPPESTKVQASATAIITHTAEILTGLFDVTATKDWGNCAAHADIVVDGKVLVKAAPITFLLFVEKQLVDILTFVRKLPILDAGDTWEYDSAADVYATPAVQTVRTKKIPRNHVKAEATDKHPAQVELYHEDVTVGYWRTVKFSGALPAKRVNELVARVEALQHAVKFAREEANSLAIENHNVGKPIFDYLFS